MGLSSVIGETHMLNDVCELQKVHAGLLWSVWLSGSRRVLYRLAV